MSSTEPKDFAREIADMREQLARLFATHGAETALKQLPGSQAVSADSARIVVVGEVGAGKTAFVNAMLDRPGPLPTEPTKTAVALDTHVASDEPSALRDMTLFDTPGVGGLDETSAQTTLAALDQATALVFVCSVESKISIAERDFLAEAARRVDHIVFVGSKVDLLADLGAANLREDEQTLAGSSRFPNNRFADLTFLPFSARIAGDARDNARMLAASGVPVVRERLNQIATRQAVYGQLNVMRAMKEAITLAYQELHRRKHAIDHPAAREELDRLTDQLTQLRESVTTWRRRLSRHIEDAHDAVRDAHKHRIKAVRTDFQQRLARREKVQIRDLETDLVEALCQAQSDANADLRGAVAEIARDLWRQIFQSESEIADLADKLPTPGESPAEYIAARTKATRDAADAMAGVQQGYIGTMMWQNLTRAVGTTGLISTHAASAAASMGVALPLASPGTCCRGAWGTVEPTSPA